MLQQNNELKYRNSARYYNDKCCLELVVLPVPISQVRLLVIMTAVDTEPVTRNLGLVSATPSTPERGVTWN